MTHCRCPMSTSRILTHMSQRTLHAAAAALHPAALHPAGLRAAAHRAVALHAAALCAVALHAAALHAAVGATASCGVVCRASSKPMREVSLDERGAARS
eukprot:CAMPEP_0181210310 /NCGR_PEP_ID=MMETSP1096-20121128/23156_1 /TAXON_ID=156174 ORGANISM="Chrysochromulina ericina, Strain CCMP281" /NCGR_SAMPLE_ID=MMETSP1096 /ASSEMBLY_ACC=CAM_ASM_000453 /LENGTH=98 /DNA_ID=CAMNT_0023301579 /DNA_START=68 /DNA_END=364 /DNA_ORIENTATION=+